MDNDLTTERDRLTAQRRRGYCGIFVVAMLLPVIPLAARLPDQLVGPAMVGIVALGLRTIVVAVARIMHASARL